MELLKYSGITDHSTYLKWCLKNHPDKSIHNSLSIFQEVSAAYDKYKNDLNPVLVAQSFKCRFKPAQKISKPQLFKQKKIHTPIPKCSCGISFKRVDCPIHEYFILSSNCIKCSKPAERCSKYCKHCLMPCKRKFCYTKILNDKCYLKLEQDETVCFFHKDEANLKYIDPGISESIRCGKNAYKFWPKNRNDDTCKHLTKYNTWCTNNNCKDHVY